MNFEPDQSSYSVSVSEPTSYPPPVLDYSAAKVAGYACVEDTPGDIGQDIDVEDASGSHDPALLAGLNGVTNQKRCKSVAPAEGRIPQHRPPSLRGGREAADEATSPVVPTQTPTASGLVDLSMSRSCHYEGVKRPKQFNRRALAMTEKGGQDCQDSLASYPPVLSPFSLLTSHFLLLTS